jgi:uncharacterized protein
VRIDAIDSLRGIAILGILFMNIYYHGVLTTGYAELTPKPFNDSAIEIFNAIFADGRFRTLFCLLFGVGLAVQYKYCQKRQLSPKLFLTARTHWLMLFGLLHGVFIFGGDILLFYGICTLTILDSLSLPLKALYQRAVKFLGIGIVLTIIIAFLCTLFSEEVPLTRESQEYLDLYSLWLSSYGYQVAMQSSFTITLILVSPLFIYWQTAGLMMLGAFLFRIGFFKKGFNKPQLIKITLTAFIFTCTDIALFLSYPSLNGEMSTIMASVSAIFVSLLYVHLIIKLTNNRSRFIKIFIAPGKLAFSLYILQSVAMACLLRIWNQDFHLTAQRFDYLLIALLFSLIQIGIAHWYLHYFNQGPLEFIWRRAYLRSFNKKNKTLKKLNRS